jgi:hypothetical protein
MRERERNEKEREIDGEKQRKERLVVLQKKQ